MNDSSPRTGNGHPLDIIGVDEAGTLHGLFRRRVERTPDAVAYRQYDADGEVWNSYSWEQLGGMVARWRAALEQEGLAAGDRVAIQLPNSVEWVCLDQAALALGLVVVPLYTTDTPSNIAYILEDADARLLLLGTVEQWRLLASGHRLPGLRRAVCLAGEGGAGPENDRLRLVSEWLPDDATERSSHTTEPGQLATIVYTSGTTGRPKGVMLSHHNILWNAHAILEIIPAWREDLFLSFLPLFHAFERTVGYYLPMMAGSTVAYARSIPQLAEDLVTHRPTVLVSVPRIYERVYGRIDAKLEQEGRLARWLFRRTIELGWQRFEAAQGRVPDPTFWQRLGWRLLRRLVANKVMARLGGRIRIAVSGGAPLTGTIARFFIGLGLPLLQGYGLTEASPVVSTNRPEDNQPAGVGPPIPGVEVMLGDGDELLVRSPGVMLGYWQRPEATEQAVDAEGWLHTGDVAERVDGHIHIRGRIKEIIVMSTGEKAPPTDLEQAIVLDPLFEQAMVIGEGRPYLAVLLVLNPRAWNTLAGELGLDPEDGASLITIQAREAILERVGGLLRHFPHHAQVRAVEPTLESWSVENGLLTPTMKLKRTVIEEKFSDRIARLYAGHT